MSRLENSAAASTSSGSALKAKWRAGEPTLGLWLSSASLPAAEVLGDLAYDYINLDLQHGLISYADAVPALQVLAGSASTLLCRVPWNEPGIIGKVLDAGAMGVIIPMVNTKAEAEQAVRACRYAPDGARSYGPIRAARRFGADYASRANAEVACIPMIETAEAVANLDAILDVPGIDAVYVGPADLSISLGLPPGSDNEAPSFQNALSAIVAGCQARAIIPGIHTVPSLVQKRLAQGFRMVTVTSDLAALVAGASLALRTATDPGTGPGSTESIY